jgi:tetratricopeptide (TPR) repeat protein
MVHNGYLQIALSSGVLGLVLYLAFLMLIFLRLWKSFQRSGEGRGKVLLLAFMASFFGFLIQDLSGWPDIALTPFFWILLGLGLSFCLTDQPQRPEKFGRIAAYFLWAIFGGSVLFLGFLIPDAFNRLAADRLFGVSQRLSIAEEWPEIESNITKAVQRVPRDAHYQDLCGVYYIRRLGLTGEPVLYREGAAFLKKAHSLNPFDPYVLIHRIDLDQVALAKGLISEAARETQQAMFKLQAMDRNNPTIYRAMAKLKIREKKYSEALALIDQANRLNRAAPNPREEWTAAQHGRFLELVKEREYPSAQKVLQEVITQYPDDSPTYVLMGNLFLAMNKPDKARESFQAALDLDKDNRDAQEGLKKIGATSGNSLSQ